MIEISINTRSDTAVNIYISASERGLCPTVAETKPFCRLYPLQSRVVAVKHRLSCMQPLVQCELRLPPLHGNRLNPKCRASPRVWE